MMYVCGVIKNKHHKHLLKLIEKRSRFARAGATNKNAVQHCVAPHELVCTWLNVQKCSDVQI